MHSTQMRLFIGILVAIVVVYILQQMRQNGGRIIQKRACRSSCRRYCSNMKLDNNQKEFLQTCLGALKYMTEKESDIKEALNYNGGTMSQWCQRRWSRRQTGKIQNVSPNNWNEKVSRIRKLRLFKVVEPSNTNYSRAQQRIVDRIKTLFPETVEISSGVSNSTLKSLVQADYKDGLRWATKPFALIGESDRTGTVDGSVCVIQNYIFDTSNRFDDPLRNSVQTLISEKLNKEIDNFGKVTDLADIETIVVADIFYLLQVRLNMDKINERICEPFVNNGPSDFLNETCSLLKAKQDELQYPEKVLAACDKLNTRENKLSICKRNRGNVNLDNDQDYCWLEQARFWSNDPQDTKSRCPYTNHCSSDFKQAFCSGQA